MIDNIESGESFFYSLYQRYRRFVLSEAWKYCSNHYDVEDLTQEVWLILVGRVDQLERYSHYQLCGYISVAVRNTAISMYRIRRVEYPLSTAENLSYDEATLLNDVFDRKLKVEIFRNVWGNVPIKERELLERKYVLSQNDNEIAQIMGIRKNSVRMYLTRARKKAATVFEPYKDRLI